MVLRKQSEMGVNFSKSLTNKLKPSEFQFSSSDTEARVKHQRRKSDSQERVATSAQSLQTVHQPSPLVPSAPSQFATCCLVWGLSLSTDVLSQLCYCVNERKMLS